MPDDKYQMTNTRMPEIMCQVRIEPCCLPFAILSICHLESGIQFSLQRALIDTRPPIRPGLLCNGTCHAND